MAKFSAAFLAQLFFSATGTLAGLVVDVNDAASIKKAAGLVAGDLMSFYKGDIPGLLPGPPPLGDYEWWTGGALWTTMLNYRNLTGDTQYDDRISQGLLWQRGPNNDFLTPNWTLSTSNDDQSVWGMAALSAAETGFTEPGGDSPTWLTLAQNVYSGQSNNSRHVKDGDCKGALRWQIIAFNNGFNYVATAANAAYANLGARLNLLQANQAQAASVQETFQLLQTLKFIDDDFNVYNGAPVPNCSPINKLQISQNSAFALEGAAAMFNSTGDAKWKTLVDGLVNRTIDLFFPGGVAKEIACEPSNCTIDMTFYKSFLHRSLASTAKMAPHTAGLILPVLKTSAAAAVQSCTGGANQRMCGLTWPGGSNNQTGAGSEMSVLSTLLSLMTVPSSNPGSGSGTGGSIDSPSTTGNAPSPTNTPGGSGAHVGVNPIVLLGSLLLTSFMLQQL
ncbi:glycosyl hydrolase family 76-domain-containing protein [Xylaria intraflava]|nr:glycosyl hydrolase family 76-domain-containing protein [Xylaria intraflava]